MTTKDVQETIVSIMEKWKKIENASIANTAKCSDQTCNPFLQLVMEIIQHDSQMHFRVQEFIQRSLTTDTVALTPDDLSDVWGTIEEHVKIELDTVKMAKNALKELSGRKMVVQEYLLQYLLTDEKKHNKMLEDLATIKKGMYPYG